MATSADFFQPSGTANLALGRRKKSSPGITEQLRALEQEFVDGDITEKGYLKKKRHLLEAARGPTLFCVDGDDDDCCDDDNDNVESDDGIQSSSSSATEIKMPQQTTVNNNQMEVEEEEDSGHAGNGFVSSTGCSFATITLSESRLKKKLLQMANGTENDGVTNGEKNNAVINLDHKDEINKGSGDVDENDGDDDDLDEICQHYLDQQHHLNALRPTPEKEIRAEAVIEALNGFSENNHPFRASNLNKSESTRGSSRNRASSVSLSNSSRAAYRRRKSASSSHTTRSCTPVDSPQSMGLHQEREDISLNSSGSNGRCASRRDVQQLQHEQVPDIIQDLHDLEQQQASTSVANNNGEQRSVSRNGDASPDLEQLIMSNFNYGTASLAHHHRKNKKSKKKQMKPQQVMYLAGRGTTSTDLMLRASTNALAEQNEQPQPQQQQQVPITQFRGRVSTKIEQLARTLRRPKPKPLAEYFCDDTELLFEDSSRQQQQQQQQQRNAEEQPPMVPCVGEPVRLGSGVPLNPLFALFRYGSSSTYRSAALSTVDPKTNKLLLTVTYHKLLENAQKLAYALTMPKKLSQLTPNELLHSSLPVSKQPRPTALAPGAKVVLAYGQNEAVSFTTAFYACLLAGLVPVPVEPPSSGRRESSAQSIGVFVGAVGASAALSSFETYRHLPKDPNLAKASPKCWPQIDWLLYEHSMGQSLSKPAKQWKPFVTPEMAPEPQKLALVLPTTTRDGDVLPLAISMDSLTKHVQSLGAALGAIESQLILNLLDVKQGFGLWYSMLAATYYGFHVIHVELSQLKRDPQLWLRITSKFRPTVVVSRSRDLHWTVLAHRTDKTSKTGTSKLAKIDLSSVKQLVVADGANSWSNSPCETFVSEFATSAGFKADAITPLAFSPDCLTIALRRPNHVTSDARLALDQLAHNHVQLDCTTLRCLALQDCGSVLPGSSLAVVRVSSSSPDVTSGLAELCQPDEIGELCLHRSFTLSYLNLPGQTSSAFAVQIKKPPPRQPPVNPGLAIEINRNEPETPTVLYCRSGLYGFISPTGNVFVVGSRQSAIFTNGRRYSADDLAATILAVEPTNFVYRGRLCLVGVRLARDERIVAVAEQNLSEFDSDSAAFSWMAKVIQAVDSIHQVSLYALCVVQPGRLPRQCDGFVDRHATRRLFEDGNLHPTNILLCPHSAVTNLPQPRVTPQAVHPSAQLLSNLLHGQKQAIAQGPPIQNQFMAKSDSFDSHGALFGNGLNTVSSVASSNSARTTPPVVSCEQPTLPERLKLLAQRDPERVLYSFGSCNAIEITAAQLHKRAERTACQLLEKGKTSAGDRIVILLPAPSVDLLAALYGSIYVGCVPMAVRCPAIENLPATLSSCFLTLQICKPQCLITTAAMARLLRSKDAIRKLLPQQTKPCKLPRVIAVDGHRGSSSSKRLATIFRPLSLEAPMYIDLVVSSGGSLTGVTVSHLAAMALCRSIKVQCELYPSREVLLAGLDTLSGLGFGLFALCPIFAGHRTHVVPLSDIESDPQQWLRLVSQTQTRDVFVSPTTLELSVRGALSQSSTPVLNGKGNTEEIKPLDLSNVRSCVVIAEERPNIGLISQFVRTLSPHGLHRRSVSAAFGCRVNVCMCLQPATAPEPEQVHVDLKSLRHDRLAIVERGSPHAVCVTALGRPAPGTRMVVANAETRALMGEEQLGEVWVSATHNASSFFTVAGVTRGEPGAKEVLAKHDAKLNARLATGDISAPFARTGFLGFIRNGELFIVGDIDQSLLVNNQRYQPCDLEATLLKLDPRRVPESAVFVASNLLVAVIEFDGPESWALDLIPAATRSLLEEHQLIAGVVVIVEPGTVPLNSRGEKQRALLRDAFLADQLDPIYVSYNL